MKRFAMKGAVLFVSTAALAAFAVPAVASAATWGPLNSTKVLTGYPTFGMTGLWGGASIACAGGTLTTHTRTLPSANLDITGASWTGCFGTGALAGVTVTMVPTALPWVATATAVPNIVQVPIHLSWTLSGPGTIPTFADGVMNAQWNPSTHALTMLGAYNLTMTMPGYGVIGTMTTNAAYTNSLLTLS